MDLGAGYSCAAFNPLTSIHNSFNDIKNSVDNIEQSVITNLQGSIAEYPMYLLAQADPDLYNLINNTLLASHQKIDVLTKTLTAKGFEIESAEYLDGRANGAVEETWNDGQELVGIVAYKPRL